GALDVQFLFYPDAVCLHRLNSDPKSFANLARAPSLSEQLENLHLAIAQCLNWRPRFSPPLSNQMLHHGGGHALIEEKFSLEYVPDCGDHTASCFTLHHVTARSGQQGSLSIVVFLVHGEHEHGDFRTTSFKLLDQFNARGVLQRKIDDCRIRQLSQD